MCPRLLRPARRLLGTTEPTLHGTAKPTLWVRRRSAAQHPYLVAPLLEAVEPPPGTNWLVGESSPLSELPVKILFNKAATSRASP